MNAEALNEFKSSILDRLKGIQEKKDQAEKNRSDYLKLRDNLIARITEVEKEIEGFSKQLESGQKAISDLEKLAQDGEEAQKEAANANQSTAGMDKSKDEEVEEDLFMTEDGLPMMEIYEELDDDGNIIGKDEYNLFEMWN